MKIKKKYNSKMIKNAILFALLIVFTFWFLLRNQDLNELIHVIKSSNKIYVLISIFLMFLVVMVESINVRSILVSLGEKKFSILRALKYTAIGFFFSAITPAATGGQPVEIYYMSKDGVKSHNGALAMLIQLCGFQISTILLSLISVIFNYRLLSGGVIWFYLLGLLINGIALILMLIGVFSNNSLRKVINFLIKIMRLIRIKNLEVKEKKIYDVLDQYSSSAIFIKNNKLTFVEAILRVFVQIIIYHSIPFFIYKSFGLNQFSYIELFSIQAILYTTISGIPLPGAIGVSESLFLRMYGLIFGVTLLSGAMLLYRFVSFYLFVAIFLVVVIINAFKYKDIEGDMDKEFKKMEKKYDSENVEKSYLY